jgi:FAD/FMN-containing dehydrogenase
VISTNAGGVNVLRYGMTRQSVLGLEVVLADGSVVNGLRRLHKDNAGYDWKQIFIGSEGSLGIVTAAVLRLVPRPRERSTALLAVPSPEASLALLARARAALGDAITAFELISGRSLRIVEQHFGASAGVADSPWFVLMEAAGSIAGLRAAVEDMLVGAIEDGDATDGVLAESETQANELWSLREHITDAEKAEGPSVKHDVSVPVADIPAFLAAASAAVAAAHDGAWVNAFGHVGDGNIHFNVVIPPGMEPHAVNHTVHEIVARFAGSISAEHGIGQYRIGELATYKSAPELALQRRLKQAMDPAGLLNPGKVLPG